MILKLVESNAKVLRTKSKRVVKFDQKLKKFVRDMEETLLSQNDPEGVGLAAPQVGKNIQVFIMSFEPSEAKKHHEKDLVKVIINPKIISVGKVVKAKRNQKEVLEGCLSLPHFYGPIARADSITIEYQDVGGQSHKQKFVDFPAAIILHELDHLNGILFVDRLLEQRAPLYEYSKGKWYEVELP